MKASENTHFKDSTPIDSYLAVGYAEGFKEPPHQSDIIRAWAKLVETEQCWILQGFFGRQANAFIEEGILSKKGDILIDLDDLDDLGEIRFISP